MKQESRTNINRVKKDISSPESFTPPEELKRQLITTMQSIYDEEDIEAVERAYKVAYKAHEKQKRKSGEPYIIHPICVAIILAELELDKETIMAGLLHDVVEDPSYFAQTCGPSAEYANNAVYASREAKREIKRNDGYLCTDRTPSWYFKD